MTSVNSRIVLERNHLIIRFPLYYINTYRTFFLLLKNFTYLWFIHPEIDMYNHKDESSYYLAM